MIDERGFYLGTHQIDFLYKTDVPLFVSRRRLKRYKSWPAARGPVVIDSGGFTELHDYGRWTLTPAEYVAELERYIDAIGVDKVAWVAPMDWMCEASVLKRTGLTVLDHQRRTIENYRCLTELAPHIPFAPVLQGWLLDDYLRHIELYASAGVSLEGIVGVGSVCRRNSTTEICSILRRLSREGLRLHAFGVKGDSYSMIGPLVESCDSMAWSFRARKRAQDGEPTIKPSCTHASCANCLDFALWWREDQLRKARENVPAAQAAAAQLELEELCA